MVKPKIICVTGGKGGTGKTLVAVNLAIMFKNQGYKVSLRINRKSFISCLK